MFVLKAELCRAVTLHHSISYSFSSIISLAVEHS